MEECQFLIEKKKRSRKAKDVSNKLLALHVMAPRHPLNFFSKKDFSDWIGHSSQIPYPAKKDQILPGATFFNHLPYHNKKRYPIIPIYFIKLHFPLNKLKI